MRKKYPKVRFAISKKKELEVFSTFSKESRFKDNRREMNWAFYQPHPKLRVLVQEKLAPVQKKLIVEHYVARYYKKYLAKIKNSIGQTKNGWQKLETEFFKQVDEIFKNHPWPKGKYLAYSTIWGMYPRFLEEKTFFFPYRHKKRNFNLVVIAHEMLHFIFYDYVYKKFPKFKNHKYDFDLWHLSEIFNVIIQNSPQWIKIFRQKTMAYPEHRKYIPKLKRLWQRNQKVDKWVLSGLEILH